MEFTFVEGELTFNFSGCTDAKKVDIQGIAKPEGMSFVDFLVEEADRLLFIEVKDPSNSKATPECKKNYREKLSGNELINSELVPKARDSWSFFHLMDRIKNKPIDYIVLICIEQISFDPRLIGPLTDKLRMRIKREGPEAWKNPYIRKCSIVTMDSWPRLLKAYSLKRSHSSFI
jgi:hypothetical protein